MKLPGKIAIVTGSGSGIGRATAKLFAQEGARLVLVDLDEPSVATTADEIKQTGGEALAIKVDVTQPEQVSAMVDEVLGRFGQIDILVNNAGIIRDAMSWRMTDTDWSRVLEVNLTGSFLCCRAAIPSMRSRNYGKIINTSSISALGNPGQVNYSAAKAGIMALTKTLSLELARSGINVNCVAPGSIDTPMVKSMPQHIIDRMVEEKVPLRRMGHPDEVAKLHLFLASDDSSYITGQVIFIDGGVSVGV